MEKKRITATKTRVKDVTTGNYMKQEGMNPNYVLTNSGQRLSRVRIIATVVDKFISETGKFAAVTIDDGTDTIRGKVFNAVSMFDNIEVGNIIDLIGRVKEYNGEIYLAPEIITKSDASHEMLRELELRIQDKDAKKIRDIVLQYKNQVADFSELCRIMKERFEIEEPEVEAILQTKEPEKQEPVDTKKKILELIEKLDAGQGCDYAELIEASNLPEEQIDSVINELLSEGTCFEPKPGKIKKL
ncbi:MAG: OB-fold nucleic acid binding domain-containing protein [Candidatus Aenigmarchaeota archaeon]|nr:OB-fold nucleic acid binding domain-containing protein [Candidatus Aenigmarchaeota archaeon]